MVCTQSTSLLEQSAPLIGALLNVDPTGGLTAALVCRAGEVAPSDGASAVMDGVVALAKLAGAPPPRRESAAGRCGGCWGG
jgi:hypothetical protein